VRAGRGWPWRFSVRLVSCAQLHSFSHTRLPQRRSVTTGLTGRSSWRQALPHERLSEAVMDMRIGRHGLMRASRVVECSKPKANRDGWSELPATAQTRGAYGWKTTLHICTMHLLPEASRALFVRLPFSSSLQLSGPAPFFDLHLSRLW